MNNLYILTCTSSEWCDEISSYPTPPAQDVNHPLCLTEPHCINSLSASHLVALSALRLAAGYGSACAQVTFISLHNGPKALEQ